MRKQHYISIITVLLLAAVSAASCADTTDPAETTSKDTEGSITATETESEETRPSHNVPVDELDFGGEEFLAITYDGHNNRYYFFADEETGDIMNDAIYERRRNTEEALNVVLHHELTTDVYDLTNKTKRTITAGEDVYDQIMLHCIQDVSMFASQGYLYNLDDLPYVDLSADWWNAEQMDVLRLGKNTYYAVNDYMIPYPFIMYFNRELVRDLDMDDPYELVQEGKWTLDVVSKMAKEVVADLNGDGKYDFENDRWGMSMQEISKVVSFMPGCDQFITSRDADGRLILNMQTDKTQSIIETIYELGQANAIYLPTTTNPEDQLGIATGRVLFYLNGPDELENLRSCEVEFGFVPYPKWDETQENYQSMDFGGLLCVPTTITDPEMVGAVHEFMAWDSGNNVVPTYYDVLLSHKFAQDETAASMLELIFDSIVYEVGGNYFGFSNGFYNLFYAAPQVALIKKTTDFASYYAQNEKLSLKTIEKFYEDLDEVEAQ